MIVIWKPFNGFAKSVSKIGRFVMDFIVCRLSLPAHSLGNTIESGHLAWQKQELGKGRLTGDNLLIAGTTWAGWGFQLFQSWQESPSGNTGGYVYNPMPSTNANAMTDAELRSSPVFMHSPSAMFSSTIPSNTVAEILACGIPALSGPIGSRSVSGITDFDMNTMPSATTWGRNSQTYQIRWLHSDLKNMAFPYVRGLFLRILERMDTQ